MACGKREAAGSSGFFGRDDTAGKGKSSEFKSAQDEAGQLGDYFVEHYGGKVDILYGVSHGCFVPPLCLRGNKKVQSL
ncbi:hypothetical protein D7V86_13170 [bacterium D16-51]|nr:hypothetical protein D7V96_17300 [bacterium D16-59]RKI59299.1 hypothetical protein D7V86_13170 [bacterium D16-51]